MEEITELFKLRQMGLENAIQEILRRRG